MGYKRRFLEEKDYRGIIARLRSMPVCDFCGVAYPVWVYAAKRLSTGKEVECWRWTACLECGRDVEDKNWDRLKNRMAKPLASVGRVLKMDAELIKAAITQSFQTFLNDAIEEND